LDITGTVCQRDARERHGHAPARRAQVTAIFLADAGPCLPTPEAWPGVWEEHQAWRRARDARDAEDARRAAQAEKARARPAPRAHARPARLRQGCCRGAEALSERCWGDSPEGRIAKRRDCSGSPKLSWATPRMGADECSSKLTVAAGRPLRQGAALKDGVGAQEAKERREAERAGKDAAKPDAADVAKAGDAAQADAGAKVDAGAKAEQANGQVPPV